VGTKEGTSMQKTDTKKQDLLETTAGTRLVGTSGNIEGRKSVQSDIFLLIGADRDIRPRMERIPFHISCPRNTTMFHQIATESPKSSDWHIYNHGSIKTASLICITNA
jgi:hypothetical protein